MPTTTPFNNLITFSRGSNATVTGPNGLIQWAPNNLLTFSEQFDNAAWVKTAVTATANSTVAPNGTTTADTITASAGAGYHYAAQNAAVVAGTTYTASMYVRAGTARYIGFGDAGDAVWHSAYLDTTDGSILNQVNCVATAVSVGGGWFFVTNTFTRTNAANAQIYVGGSTVTGSAGPLFTATGTETCIAWGAQLELGSTATTYNPTTVKNLLGFSEAFDNAAWTKGGASIVTGAQANPVNGLFNAQKLMEDTSTGDHRTFQAANVTNGTPYVFSAYVKPAGRTLVNLTSVSGALMNVTFDVSTGVITSTTNGVGSIVSVGSGWYRIAVTATATSTAAANFQIRLLNNVPALSYTGDGNSGVYIYGAQLSDSASLDPYVPTPGAAPSSTAFYGPRFDFDPVTLQPRGLLVEEQRTNLLLQSEDWSTATWVKNLTTVTANATPSPDGTSNADRLTETAASGEHFTSQQIAKAASNITYTKTAYFKNGAGTRNFGLGITDGTTGGYGAVFSTSGAIVSASFAIGSVVGWTFVSSSVVPAGNGWFRASLTVTSNTATRLDGVCYLVSGTTTSYAGDGASNIFLYGAQLEAGAFATSYIPTVASTVTRSADVAAITGQNFAQWYSQPEGTLAIEVSTVTGASNRVVELSTGSTARVVDLYLSAPFLQMFNGTSAFNATGNVPLNTPFKAAGAYRSGNYGVVLNGAAVTANTDTLVNTANALQIGRFSSGSNYLNGHIRSIRFIPARAADFQLQGLST